MSRPPDRIEPMLQPLRELWLKHPDQRLGQLVANAGRDKAGFTRDLFNVEDDDLWDGLQRDLGEDIPYPFGPDAAVGVCECENHSPSRWLYHYPRDPEGVVRCSQCDRVAYEQPDE